MNQGHKPRGNGPQFYTVPARKRSVIVKFRMPEELFLEYEEKRKLYNQGSVALFCQHICINMFPKLWGDRVLKAKEFLAYSFSKEEIEAAKGLL